MPTYMPDVHTKRNVHLQTTQPKLILMIILKIIDLLLKLFK